MNPSRCFLVFCKVNKLELNKMTPKYFLLFFVFSLLFGSDSSYQDGILAYNSRALNANGMVAQTTQIDQAIDAFTNAKQSPDHELDAGVYLLRSYYYKGKFVTQDDKGKKEIFNLGKNLGEELVEKFPKSAAIRYWYLVNLGSWSEVYGIFAAAKEGVADIMRDHAEIIIDLDLNYSNGGGYFMLGAVHLKSPYIPFLLSWPNNDEALDFLTKSFQTGIATPTQTVYRARAFYKDGQKERAIQLLKKLISQPLSNDEPVEDFEQHHKAKAFLAEWL